MDDMVIIGEWKDEAFYTLQQEAMRRTPTQEEQQRLIAGPRRHPFGPEAYEVAIDGQWVVFPNKEAAGV
jgi:hypothetical protein